LRRSFDCAVLSTSVRIDDEAAGSGDAEAGTTIGAFSDCFVFEAMVRRIAGIFKPGKG